MRRLLGKHQACLLSAGMLGTTVMANADFLHWLSRGARPANPRLLGDAAPYANRRSAQRSATAEPLRIQCVTHVSLGLLASRALHAHTALDSGFPD